MEGTEGREQAKEREDSLHFDLKVSTSFGLWNHSRVAEVTRALKICPRDGACYVSRDLYVSRTTHVLAMRSLRYVCAVFLSTTCGDRAERERQERPCKYPFHFRKMLGGRLTSQIPETDADTCA